MILGTSVFPQRTPTTLAGDLVDHTKITGMHATRGETWKSAIAKHQWDQQHQVDWDGTRVLDRAKGKGIFTHREDSGKQWLN